MKRRGTTHRVSVIVPTRGRPEAVARLLKALGRQELPPGIELEAVLAFDGGRPAKGLGHLTADSAVRLRTITLPRVGISEAKNLAVNQATGDILLFLNDDVEPEPDLVREHVLAGEACGFKHLVLGRTDWHIDPDDTAMELLVRATSMVFFYDQMQDGDLCGFRHAWNLNLSMAREAFEAVGGFRSELRPCMFEDIELAWRLERKGHRVLYHAAARAVHHHRYTWEEYLQREVMLGLMAPVLWRVNPDCFREIWKNEPNALEPEYRHWLDMDQGDHRKIAGALSRSLALSAAKMPGNGNGVALLYGMHLPLKRRAFRAGFLAGTQTIETVPWQERLRLASKVLRRALYPDDVRQGPAAEPVSAQERKKGATHL